MNLFSAFEIDPRWFEAIIVRPEDVAIPDGDSQISSID
jgi:hypothetical protein